MPIVGERFPFIAYALHDVPDEAGVYALWDGGELIYLGRAARGAATLRRRLWAHLDGREGPCTQAASHFGWERTPDLQRRHEELLGEVALVFRRRPRCNAAG